MTHPLHTPDLPDSQAAVTSVVHDDAATSGNRRRMWSCGMGHTGLKGVMLMAVCCGAPLILLLALPVFGVTLGGLGVSVVNALAVLACPLGMGVMLWLMLRK